MQFECESALFQLPWSSLEKPQCTPKNRSNHEFQQTLQSDSTQSIEISPLFFHCTLQNSTESRLRACSGPFLITAWDWIRANRITNAKLNKGLAVVIKSHQRAGGSPARQTGQKNKLSFDGEPPPNCSMIFGPPRRLVSRTLLTFEDDTAK